MQNVQEASANVAAPAFLNNVPFALLKPYIASLVWQLYDANKTQAVFSVRKWFISITITVEQIRPLLEQWFGPHP